MSPFYQAFVSINAAIWGQVSPLPMGAVGLWSHMPRAVFQVAEASVSMASAKGRGQCLGSPRVSIPGIGKRAAVSATLQVGKCTVFSAIK